MKISKAIASCVSAFLSITLLLNGLAMPAQAQTLDRVIIVNADQPNIWTLEQAHYLLAQMHRRNLDLKAKSLEDLDPNEITGLRFEVLKTMIELGATFNQADLASNRMFAQNQEFNSTRRSDLTAEADRLRNESLTLAAEIDDLENKKADAESDAEKERLDARIASKKNRLARVDKEIENINNELKTLNVSGGELRGTAPPDGFNPEKLPKGLADDAVKEAFADQLKRFNEAPKLNASLRLENFLQMQYEIIAKQLSLLRDELGPGERLLFLELPQTLNVSHHEANRKWAQSWWKIAGYTRRERQGDPREVPSPTTPPVRDNQRPIKTSQDVNSIVNGDSIPLLLDERQRCKSEHEATPTDVKAIWINDTPTSAKPSPLTATVENMPGTVEKVTVEFRGLRHPYPDDIDMLLVGPQGQNALIWSDAGGFLPVENLDITLDDAAGSDLPDGGGLSSQSYRPSNHGQSDKFPGDTPTPLGGSALSVFKGTNANGVWRLFIIDDDADSKGLGSIAQGWSLKITTKVNCDEPPARTHQQVAYQNVFVPLNDTAGVVESNLNSYLVKSNSALTDRTVRTVELIPRQGSLNVNDMKLKTTAGAFNFLLTTLFGFGAQVNVQRQREQFAQFVQQELYSSAFGKGSREFGWTFTPMPGMDRLQSGVRTTYAVVIVPDDATSIVLEANGCYFPRSAYQPLNFKETKDPDWNVQNRTSRNCGGQRTKAFIVPIPTATIDGSNDFWVNRISYQPVGKGERIVVLISGQNFSSQIGVMINGTPLPHSIGLAQPLIRDDSNAGRLTEQDFQNEKIKGRIERIDANKIVFSFQMPADYAGTPTITLVAPGKAIDLNWLTNIGINGDDPPATLSSRNKDACKTPPTPGCAQVGTPMFSGDPPPPEFRIDRVEAFRRANNTLNVLIHGAGFAAGQKVFINGVMMTVVATAPARATTSSTLVSQTLISATIKPAPLDDQIQIAIDNSKKTIKSTGVVNPLQLRIDKVTVVSYEEPTNRRRGVLVVRLEGLGFTNGLRTTPRRVQLNVTSSKEAFLTIPNPNQSEIVTLTDPVTTISVSTLVIRKPPE